MNRPRTVTLFDPWLDDWKPRERRDFDSDGYPKLAALKWQPARRFPDVEHWLYARRDSGWTPAAAFQRPRHE